MSRLTSLKKGIAAAGVGAAVLLAPAVAQAKEVPLDQWIDTEDSRVKFSYMFQLWLDLAIIYRRYKQ